MERRVFENLWYRCTLCDLKTRPSCSDSPATRGRPNMGRFVFIGLELLLFVAASLSSAVVAYCGALLVSVCKTDILCIKG